MNEATKTRKENWRELLLEDENRAFLHKALSSFPPAVLTRMFKASFRPHDPEVVALTGKKLSKITASDILENLEKIHERKPDVLEGLVEFWLDRFVGNVVEQLDTADTPPNALAVIAWLWSQTPSAPVPEWHTIQALATKYAEQQSEITELQQEVKRARLASGKQDKTLSKHEAKAADQEKKARQLKSELTAKVKEVKRREQNLAELKQDLTKYQERIAELKNAISQKDDEHARDSQTSAGRYESLNAKYQQLRADCAALEKEHKKILQKAAEADADEAERMALIQELEEEIKSLQEAKKLDGLPLDPEALESTLMIDYEALGDEPAQRLITLLDLYEAALYQKPHPLLEERTNWLTLTNKEFCGILLLGLETLLLDALKLPLRQYLETRGFSKEQLLRSLTHQIVSPRFVGTSDG